jgi:hypothetical protein
LRPILGLLAGNERFVLITEPAGRHLTPSTTTHDAHDQQWNGLDILEHFEEDQLPPGFIERCVIIAMICYC